MISYLYFYTSIKFHRMRGSKARSSFYDPVSASLSTFKLYMER
jgi:hypothetical protein